MAILLFGLFLLWCFQISNCDNEEYDNNSDSFHFISEVLMGCLDSDTIFKCLLVKNTPVFDKSINNKNSMFSKLLTDNLEEISSKTKPRARTGNDDGGLLNFNSKAIRKEKKYSKYAFLVLLGIFGLTGPLFMKILSIVAAQALLASKAALILVGSIALKKLFENKEETPVVKVSTLPLHDLHDVEESKHDRLGFGGGQTLFNYEFKENNPLQYFLHYKQNTNRNINNFDFMPIIRRKIYRNVKVN